MVRRRAWEVCACYRRVAGSMMVDDNLRQPSPTKRHEVMNMVVEKCCVKIGKACYTSKPTAEFKDALVVVFYELGRYQQEQGRLSLRGHEGEEKIVKGVWAVAAWPIRRDAW